MAKKCSNVSKSSKGGEVSNVKRNLKLSYAADTKTLDVIDIAKPFSIYRLENVHKRNKACIAMKIEKDFDYIYEFLARKDGSSIVLQVIPNHRV